MTSQFDVLNGLLGMVNVALAPGGVPITPYQAAIGYPSIGVLQNIAKGGPAIVSIYDRKISKNSTRWNPFVITQTATPATLTTTLSQSGVRPGGTAQITLGGTVSLGDAVSALAVSVGNKTSAVVAIGGASDTPTTMATQLAGLINSDPSYTGVMSATAAGPVVTLTNLRTIGLGLASYVGNGGSQTREIGRRMIGVQIIIWAQTVEIRNLMTAALAIVIAEAELNFGPAPDGTAGRLDYVSDYDLEDDTLSDSYRHDFMLSMDYTVTTVDALYAVLAPVLNYSVQFEGLS